MFNDDNLQCVAVMDAIKREEAALMEPVWQRI